MNITSHIHESKMVDSIGIFWKNKQDQLHRDNDWPAIEYSSGSYAWFVNGKKHRLTGPAFDSFSGQKLWFIYDVKLTKEEFDYWVENNGTDWNGELETLFKLSYS